MRKIAGETTYIKVTNTVAEELKNRGKKGESYNDVLKRVLGV